MKSKALLVGAGVSPFVGPWSSLEGLKWKCVPEFSYGGRVIIEAETESGETRHELNGEPVIICGHRARVLVLGELPLDIERVTVRIHAVN